MSEPGFTIPLSPIEVHARNHALLCSIGFLILLPIGALVPRYTRTLPYKWGFLSSNEQVLTLTYYLMQMVLRSLEHPVPYSRPSHPRRMDTRSSNIHVSGGRALPGSSSKNWAGPSNPLPSTIGYWRIRSLL